MNSAGKQDRGGRSDAAGALRKAAPYINASYILISAILLFGIIGWWLDDKWATKPLFLIIGLFLGLGVGFYSMIRTIQKLDREQ
jgi:F0F1-type ATP synthase assembly protein I